MKNNSIVFPVIAAAVVFGVGGFFSGMKYQQSKKPMGRFNSQNIQTNRGAFRPVIGGISATDEKSITVKLADGSSKIILLSEKTMINKATEGSKTDLTVGEKVSIFGTENSDKSISAQNIQLGSPRIQP